MTEPLPSGPREQARLGPLRWLVYLGINCANAFFIGIAEAFSIGANRAPISWTTYTILLGLAIWALLGLRHVRGKMARIAASDPSRAERIKHSRYILLMTMGTSITLYGFMARFFGGTLLHALPFYVLGALLVVTAPPNRTESASPLI